MDQLLESFTDLTTNEKTTVMAIHHNSRAGRTRGASALEGAAPFEWHLKGDAPKPDGSRLVQLDVKWKRPYEPPVQMVHKEGRFHVAPQGTVVQAAQEQRDDPGKNDGLVVGALRDGAKSVAQIAERTELGEYAVRYALKRLETMGKVRNLGAQQRLPGTQRQEGGQPHLWGLAYQQ